MKENQIKQFFKMIENGFSSIAKSIGLIKFEAPNTEIDLTGVVSEIGKTNEILKAMCDKEDKEETYEIILKIE